MASARLGDEAGVERDEEVELVVIEVERIRVVGFDEAHQECRRVSIVFEEQLLDTALVAEELPSSTIRNVPERRPTARSPTSPLDVPVVVEGLEHWVLGDDATLLVSVARTGSVST